MTQLLKLNLGSGNHPQPGYVNVDKFGSPDVVHDLETFPWPWETSSVGEVLLNHVLEHLGATTDVFFGVIRELYRVCAPGATIRIVVPHPRHDDFISDPTHVRAVTPRTFSLFSKAKNAEFQRRREANSPWGMHLDVDFEIQNVVTILDEPWATRYSKQELSRDEIAQAIRQFNNVVKEVRMVISVVKPATEAPQAT